MFNERMVRDERGRYQGSGMKSILFLIGLMVLAGPVWADFESGRAAYSCGDYETAFREFEILAKKGHAEAQVALGQMVLRGEAVGQSDIEAVKWFRKAAEQGNSFAQGKLGAAYEEGRGVPKDYVKAYMWLILAAAQGERGISRFRDHIAQKMTPEQVARAQEMARNWRPRALK